MKNNIILTTDSGMCPNLGYNPIIVPDQITCSNGKSFLDDNVSITTDSILNDKVNTYKTSAPLLFDYYNTFLPLLEDGKDIIHLSLGSGISSSSVNNANLVANELNEKYDNQVYVIDSCNGSVGGTCYYEAAYDMFLHSDLSVVELKNELEQLRRCIQTSFYVPDATGFVRSGRDNSSKYSLSKNVLTLSSSLLRKTSFKFRVDFHENGNGDLYLKKIFRSTHHNGMMAMTQDIINDDTIQGYDSKFCVIGNLYEKDVSLDEIEEYLLSFSYFDKIIRSNVGNVVAPYGCNDLCGLSLVKKK